MTPKPKSLASVLREYIDSNGELHLDKLSTDDLLSAAEAADKILALSFTPLVLLREALLSLETETVTGKTPTRSS